MMQPKQRWTQYYRVLKQSDLMDRMMAELGVDPAVAVRMHKGTAFYNARKKCLACPSPNQCSAWLKNPEGAPEFCPNYDYFDHCRRVAGARRKVS